MTSTYSLALDKSITLPERQSWTQKTSKTKPNFLARKIGKEELFSDAYRITTLGQINEENQNEIEDVSLAESVDESISTDEPKNMFKMEAVISSKYKEHGKGPAFASNGQIIRHSIVGSTEMFERQQRNIKKLANRESAMFSDKGDGSSSDNSISRLLKPLASGLSNQPSMTNIQGGRGSISMNTLITKSAVTMERKKDAKKRDIKVTKEDMYMKVDEMRKTQDKFYQQEDQKIRCLTVGDQLHHTKEKRCLEKYEDVTRHWGQTIDKFTRQIHRNHGKSVMLMSDGFREKVEQAEVYNMIQTDQERFGDTFWYMNLRKYGKDDDLGSQRVIQDIPAGFSSPQIIRPATSIEIIRKSSKFSKTSTMLPSLGETKWLDRTKKEYLEDKSDLLKKELKKIKLPMHTEVEDFVVEGRNKLEMEVTAFFKTNPSKDTYIVPRTLFKERQKEDEGEFLVVNYDNKEITKNGLAAFM